MDKILVAVSSFAKCGRQPLDTLEASGFQILHNPYGRRLKAEEVISMGRECVGILSGLEPLNKDVLMKLPKLKVISRIGVGLDNIDEEAAKSQGILIYSTADSHVQAVAELAVGLLLDLLRKIALMDRRIRAGEWKRIPGRLLQGKTIGILGLGRIGKRVAELLTGFGVSLLATDIAQDYMWLKQKKVGMVGLEELLKNSDILMLHLSGNKCVIGENELQMMKKGVYIVNVSRGSVIDETALVAALAGGRVAAAALDVFNSEPYQGALTKFENVLLTPHIGSYTEESRLKMETEAARNLLAGLRVKKGAVHG